MSKKHSYFFSILILTMLLSLLTAIREEQGESFFAEVDRFMEKYIENGYVEYHAIKNNPKALKGLLKRIESFDLEDAGKSVEMAFWINAYNLLVINSVVKHYPISSPMDVQGFFDTIKHPIAGELLTLNEIENIKLREKFKKARIHFVLVCAARSCPPIIPEAYCPATLEKQLEERTRENLNNPNFIRVDSNEKKVEISEIFKWYSGDFTAGGQSILQYINRYRDKKIPESYEVGFNQYDWSLNHAKS